MKMILKQIRSNYNMTQEELSLHLNIPLKTLQKWEQGTRETSKWVTDLVIDKLLNFKREQLINVDESHGILNYSQIKSRVNEVAKKYSINKVYLFGSYVKGEATETSDVDLYIESNISGLEFFSVAEDFKESLCKSVDLLSNKNVIEQSEVYKEIMRTGVLIHER